MIYPEVPLKDWLEKTGLDIGEFTCPKCKEVFQHTIPCATKDYYGIRTSAHGCGEGFTAVIFTPRSKEKMALWERILR